MHDLPNPYPTPNNMKHITITRVIIAAAIAMALEGCLKMAQNGVPDTYAAAVDTIPSEQFYMFTPYTEDDPLSVLGVDPYERVYTTPQSVYRNLTRLTAHTYPAAVKPPRLTSNTYPADITTPQDVFAMLTFDYAYDKHSAVFIAKQAIYETGDRAVPDTPFNPKNGLNNIFGFRVNDVYLGFFTAKYCLDTYAISLAESEFNIGDASIESIITARKHNPDPLYCQKINAINWTPKPVRR